MRRPPSLARRADPAPFAPPASVRAAALALGLAAAGCGAAPPPKDPLAGLQLLSEDPSDQPIAGLDEHWAQRFAAGDLAFEHNHGPAEGLGPLYIRPACGACHAADSKGPGGVTKMAVLGEEGVALDGSELLPFGDTERPRVTAGAHRPVLAPDDPRVRTSLRLGPAVFGRGYLEAVDEAAVLALEAEQAAGRDGVRGRAHRVCRGSAANPDQPFHDEAEGECGLLGRFGLKATVASLDDFTAKAYLGDMGLSSPLRPVELPNPDGLLDDDRPGVDLELDTLNLAADYVRLLALPRPLQPTLDGAPVRDGPALFAAAGCDRCHRPSLPTRADHPIPPLAGVEASLFSDLLLHDMGEGLADGLSEGEAGPRDWRTAPLIGLRFLGRFLHDGRADDLEGAIAAHQSPGSEANASVARFDALSAAEQDRLLAYLWSL